MIVMWEHVNVRAQRRDCGLIRPYGSFCVMQGHLISARQAGNEAVSSCQHERTVSMQYDDKVCEYDV